MRKLKRTQFGNSQWWWSECVRVSVCACVWACVFVCQPVNVCIFVCECACVTERTCVCVYMCVHVTAGSLRMCMCVSSVSAYICCSLREDTRYKKSPMRSHPERPAVLFIINRHPPPHQTVPPPSNTPPSPLLSVFPWAHHGTEPGAILFHFSPGALKEGEGGGV